MGGFLVNCQINTQRAQALASGGISAPIPYLTGVQAHAQTIDASDFRLLPESALLSEYVLTCWPNRFNALPDVRVNDLLTIWLLDGRTQWPGTNPNETFRVTFVRSLPPPLLPHLKIYVARITSGGTLYAG